MAPSGTSLSVPTTAPEPHTTRIPSEYPELRRILRKLSIESLFSLVFDWLSPVHAKLCAPQLSREEENVLSEVAGNTYNSSYRACSSVKALEDAYRKLQTRESPKTEVINRILYGDWQDGLTLYQLAMAETKHTLSNPTSLSWSAFEVIDTEEEGSAKQQDHHGRRVRVDTTHLLMKLNAELAPAYRLHHYAQQLDQKPFQIVRIYLCDPVSSGTLTPSSSRAPSRDSKTVWLVAPMTSSGSNLVWVSSSSNLGQKITGEVRTLRDAIVKALPHAVTTSHQQYTTKPCPLRTKDLDVITAHRSDKKDIHLGGWSIYAEANKLEVASLEASISQDSVQHERLSRKRANKAEDYTTEKRRKVAEARFGMSGLGRDVIPDRMVVSIGQENAVPDDSMGGERELSEPVSCCHCSGEHYPTKTALPPSASFSHGHNGGSSIDPVINNLWGGEAAAGAAALFSISGSNPKDLKFPANVSLSIGCTLQGSQIFTGLRKMVQSGVVDGEKMPSWMTGEEGMFGKVTNGRLVKP